ncbi:hypothetical protein [Thioflexithrix psekupsensis]|uniref:hypothetical protein n=1 Tax=Thioflexithrix psekupsensis TaxID=1570016 RepID=UPI00159393BA|nr:hypothetical protein [Thioflexithrix psekupsensis]
MSCYTEIIHKSLNQPRLHLPIILEARANMPYCIPIICPCAQVQWHRHNPEPQRAHALTFGTLQLDPLAMIHEMTRSALFIAIRFARRMVSDL